MTALRGGNKTAGAALARPELDRRGPLNRAEFRRGNGFETRPFGGHRWRGRYGRFRHFWAGGIFWPYLFGDYFSSAFWPDTYAYPFWAYGADSILWGALWPYTGDEEGNYAAGESDTYTGSAYGGYGDLGAAGSIGSTQTALCGGFAPGLAGLPEQRLERIIKPTAEQRAAFEELKAAVAKASQVFRTACPERLPLTPAARLDVMEQRLAAMQQAVAIIRGPLEKFYAVLSSAQIARLENAASKVDRQRSPSPNLAELCSGESGLTNVPAEDIARSVELTDEQQFDLGKLKKVSEKAANDLRASCPQGAPRSLSERLDLAQTRIAALIQAIKTVRPAVQAFYASLSDKQKSALGSRAADSRSARR
jgi:hypothetical protein